MPEPTYNSEELDLHLNTFTDMINFAVSMAPEAEHRRWEQSRRVWYKTLLGEAEVHECRADEHYLADGSAGAD